MYNTVFKKPILLKKLLKALFFFQLGKPAAAAGSSRSSAGGSRSSTGGSSAGGSRSSARLRGEEAVISLSDDTEEYTPPEEGSHTLQVHFCVVSYVNVDVTI